MMMLLSTFLKKIGKPDGKFGTNDDIFHTNINLKSSKIGEKVGEESTKLGTGFIKGVGKAIKEEFKK